MPNPTADIVVAGHICLDIILTFAGCKGRVDEFLVPGKLVNVGPPVLSTGGAVSNAGLALYRLGVPTRLMGKVGDDLFGRAILDILRGYDRALADGMLVVSGEHSSYSIIISPPGVDRIILHCPGANDTFGADDVAYEKLASARVFHFGYPPIMRRMFVDGGQALATMMRRVKEQGLTTSLDMAKPDPDSQAGRADWPALLARVLPYVDLFLPSLDEILFMLDRPRFERMPQSAGSLDSALLGELSERLLQLGAAVVVLKLGDQGLYMRTTHDTERLAALGRGAPQDLSLWKGRELHAPCFQVNVVGTTGSGDCTIAGFLAGLLHELPPEDVMTSAVAVGACSVERADATSGVPSWSAVQERIRSGWERHERRMKDEG
jgi:sugar/nucleoside kinase (ribokinase family)